MINFKINKQNLLESDLREVQVCSDIFCNLLWHVFDMALCEQLKLLLFFALHCKLKPRIIGTFGNLSWTLQINHIAADGSHKPA